MATLLEIKQDLQEGRIARRRGWRDPANFIWDRGDGLLVKLAFNYSSCTAKPFTLEELAADDWESYSVPMDETAASFGTKRMPSLDFRREFVRAKPERSTPNHPVIHLDPVRTPGPLSKFRSV